MKVKLDLLVKAERAVAQLCSLSWPPGFSQVSYQLTRFYADAVREFESYKKEKEKLVRKHGELGRHRNPSTGRDEESYSVNAKWSTYEKYLAEYQDLVSTEIELYGNDAIPLKTFDDALAKLDSEYTVEHYQAFLSFMNPANLAVLNGWLLDLEEKQKPTEPEKISQRGRKINS